MIIVSVDDLRVVRDGFSLGSIFEVIFLVAGLMNQNWRVRAMSGAYALKRISDVGVDSARRSLRVMAQLAELNHPVCMPVLTGAGDYVLEVGSNAYCVVPWISGGHPRGVELSREQADALGCKSGSASRRLSKYEHLRPLSDVPGGPFGWTHGDFQHLNMIWRNGELAAVIDWDRLKVRPFGEEVARSATLLFGHDDGWLDLGRVAAFVGGYRRSVTITDDDLLDAVDRLWWKRMCDYWHLEFHYDRGDHSCDHLFLSASRFLAWWTERLDEVRAAFTAAART